MFDPNEHRAQCETYLSHFLRGHVNFIQAEMLTKSTRNAPWRLDVETNGSAKSYMLRLDAKDSEREYQILRAMEPIPIPTPHVYSWDAAGEALGIPCFFCDYIEGESLLKPVLAGEAWAEELYLDTVCALQKITEDNLGGSLPWLRRETAMDVRHRRMLLPAHRV